VVAVSFERAGLIVPANDPRAIAAAINRLRDEPGLWRRLSAGARRRADECARESHVERLLAVYDGAMQRRASACTGRATTSTTA
jgi:glycosyltransferase involved in cell wall biosynthesis